MVWHIKKVLNLYTDISCCSIMISWKCVLNRDKKILLKESI